MIEYRVDDRVVMSDEGVRHLSIKGSRPKGQVTGFSRDGRCIYVRKDGQVYHSSYYKGFWELDTSIERPPDMADYKFDRKTFDPINNSAHRAILGTLRQVGGGRSSRYKNSTLHSEYHNPKHYSCCCSDSLEALGMLQPSEGIYLDLGAGNSPDVAIAASWGYQAHALDLFPPLQREWLENTSDYFTKADVVEPLPFANNSVAAASSHAMIALIRPDERLRFYKNVYRVLRSGGLFSLTGVKLVNGYGFSAREEKERVLSLGFEYVASVIFGFVVRK